MQVLDIIFSIAILIMSVVIHEVSHGAVAYAMGDPTAKYAGRLTLNPINHLDPFGSILLPLMTFIIPTLLGGQGFIIGWAKPVPYNPYNLSNQRWGPALVGAAGPAANIIVALLFSIVIRFFALGISQALVGILASIIFVNILLAIFNLVPIPPLDGSKVLFALLPNPYRLQAMMEEYGLFLIIIFIFFVWPVIIPVVEFIFRLFVGAV
ncbi:site-2 protease family protein [Candidatus Giovannonibacteria bacterium]|nr:site-2 protease family protein [Candidatus Giovannonibacteria bacterium]